MPNETLEKAEETSEDVEMDKQSESETPLTYEIELEPTEKPFAYAELVVTHYKRAFGKSCIKTIDSPKSAFLP